MAEAVNENRKFSGSPTYLDGNFIAHLSGYPSTLTMGIALEVGQIGPW